MAGVNTILSEWLVVILIVLSLIFEVIFHKLEHWVTHRHHHLTTIVKTLYRELMILGIISFSFIFYEIIGKPKKDIIFSFEFAHVFIFLLAILYTLVVLGSMFTSLRLSARWKETEKVDLVRYLQLKDQYTRLRLRIHKHRGPYWRNFQWWFPHFGDLLQYWQLHEMMAFHDIRFQFIFYRNLPEHFRFSSFLRRIKSVTFVELVESHWSLYLIFLAIVLGDIARRLIFEDPSQSNETDIVESAFIIGTAIALSICVQGLAMKIRSVYWKLTQNPRIYYEGVQAEDVVEEIAAAKARIIEERDTTRNSRSGDSTELTSMTADESGNEADSEMDIRASIAETARTDATLPNGRTSRVSTLLGTPNPEDGTPILSHADVAIVIEEPQTAEDEITSSAAKATNIDPPGLVQMMPEPIVDRVELDELASRHSMDIRKLKYGTGVRAATTLGIAPQARDPTGYESPGHAQGSSDVKVPIEFDEVVSRHSLEAARHSGPDVQRPSPLNRKASVAIAAVEAARRRASENQFGRHSLDNERTGERPRPPADAGRYLGSPRMLSKLSSRGASTDEEGRMSGSDYVRKSFEKGRTSIELARAMPRDEMAVRNQQMQDRVVDSSSSMSTLLPSGAFGKGPYGSRRPHGVPSRSVSDDMQSEESSDLKKYKHGQTRPEEIMRHKSLALMNKTILKNMEDQEDARRAEPNEYHWVVKKLFPRVARVASPTEKLFWFGSHKFFLWCVEFVLFFSTVLMAAATGSVFLILVESDLKMDAWNIAAMSLAGVNLMFVLFKIAGIIKKFIFILNNASLVPENLAIRAIHNVNKKISRAGGMQEEEEEDSELSGEETEREDVESALERRKTLGKFFRREAESGNMPGIPGLEQNSNKLTMDGTRRRFAVRRQSEKRRSDRFDSDLTGGDFPQKRHTEIPIAPAPVAWV